MKKDRVGLICPAGKIIETKIYGHIEALFSDEASRIELGFQNIEDLNKWAQWEESESIQEFLGSCGEDSHVPWHAFNGYADDHIRDKIQSTGFHRWGTYTNKYNEFIVVVEGRNVNSMPGVEVFNELMDFVESDECHYTYGGYRQSYTKKIKRIK